jgi:Ca2+-binding EF-hand superfamily protein
MAEEPEQAAKPTKDYEVDFNVQTAFAPQEFTEHQKIFGSYDADFSGKISKADLPEMLKAIGNRDFAEAGTADILK